MDVFIVDTGIDTTHSEFKQIPGEHVRTVKNIYDYYGGSGPVGENIDTEGHGTHVAGESHIKYCSFTQLFLH